MISQNEKTVRKTNNARLSADAKKSVGQKNSKAVNRLNTKIMQLDGSQGRCESSLECNMDLVEYDDDDLFSLTPPLYKKQKTPSVPCGYPLRNIDGKTIQEMFGIQDIKTLKPDQVQLISTPFVEEEVPWGGEILRKYITHRSNSRVQLFSGIKIGDRSFERPVVVKTQSLSLIKFDFDDSIVKEWMIHRRVTELKKDGLITNFVPMIHWFLEFQKDPNELFLHIIMPDSGETTRTLSKDALTSREFKEIIFQLLWALASADRALHLRHQDLHAGNILVKKISSNDKPGYMSEDGICLCRVTGYVVTLIDFGNVVCSPPVSKDKVSFIQFYDELKGKRNDAVLTRKDIAYVKSGITSLEWNQQELFAFLKSDAFEDLRK